jgi:hypothetical protein
MTTKTLSKPQKGAQRDSNPRSSFPDAHTTAAPPTRPTSPITAQLRAGRCPERATLGVEMTSRETLSDTAQVSRRTTLAIRAKVASLATGRRALSEVGRFEEN